MSNVIAKIEATKQSLPWQFVEIASLSIAMADYCPLFLLHYTIDR